MRDGRTDSYIVVAMGKWESKQLKVLGFKWKVEKLRNLRQHSLLGEHLKHAGLMPAHLTAQRPKESFQALTDSEWVEIQALITPETEWNVTCEYANLLALLTSSFDTAPVALCPAFLTLQLFLHPSFLERGLKALSSSSVLPIHASSFGVIQIPRSVVSLDSVGSVSLQLFSNRHHCPTQAVPNVFYQLSLDWLL